jgi:cobalt-zinc-cadmium efflux system outer membrane protein
MRKITFGIFCAVIIFAGVLPFGATLFAGDNATEVQSATVLDLDELIKEALQANPDIIASQKNSDALWERPPQAKSWDDPRLSFGVRNLPTEDRDFDEIDMTTKEVSISQVIPMPGITSLREKIAVQEAKSADRMLEFTRLQIIRAVKKYYFELYLVNVSINTTEKNLSLLTQFAEIASSQYIVGKATQQDSLKAQVEHSKLLDRLIQFNQQKKTITAQLNRLLAREETLPLAGEAVLPQHRITQTEIELDEAAQAGNPGLLSLQEIISRNKAAYDLAGKSYVPEIIVTGAYGQREDAEHPKMRRSDLFSVMVGFNVPIWFKSKQNRKVAETHYMIERSKAEYKALADEIQFKIRDIMARQTRENDLIRLYENALIPQAAQALESSVASYQVGTVDFLSLLSNQISLFNAELQLSDSQAQYQINLADLEAIVGKELF